MGCPLGMIWLQYPCTDGSTIKFKTQLNPQEIKLHYMVYLRMILFHSKSSDTVSS